MHVQEMYNERKENEYEFIFFSLGNSIYFAIFIWVISKSEYGVSEEGKKNSSKIGME